MESTPRLPAPSSAAFEYPLGIELTEGENFRQREGYEVTILRRDEETPRYQFTVAVSVARVPAVFRRLAELLPAQVRVILEVPGAMQGKKDVCEVFLGDWIDREEFLQVFEAHDHVFCHDGMVGFGAIDEKGGAELFLDDHKLLYFYGTQLEGPERALADCGLACMDSLKHFSELSHIHNSLISRGRGEDYITVFEELRAPLNLTWHESKEYD